MLQTLTPAQEDALKELSSVGAAKAASALAQLLKTTIRLTEPILRIETLQGFWSEIDGRVLEPAIAVVMEVTGQAAGSVIVAFGRQNAIEFSTVYLAQYMKGVVPTEEDILGVVQEFANIIAGPYLMALTALTEIELDLQPPLVIAGKRSAILATLPDSVKGGEAALLESRFLTDEREICGEVILVPQEGSILNFIDAFQRHVAKAARPKA